MNYTKYHRYDGNPAYIVFMLCMLIALLVGLAHREGAFDSPAPRTADQITAERLTKAYLNN